MKRIYLIAWVWMIWSNNAVAQEKEKIKFSNITQFGLLKGPSDQTYQVHTINGVKYKTWFAGVGVGLEEYYFKTIPVFVDVRRSLFLHQSTPFVYADLGLSLPFKKQTKTNWQTSSISSGLYYDLGLGYSVWAKNTIIHFSAGMSVKMLHRETASTPIWDFLPYGNSNAKEFLDYRFSRVSVKMALQF